MGKFVDLLTYLLTLPKIGLREKGRNQALVIATISIALPARLLLLLLLLPLTLLALSRGGEAAILTDSA